MQGTKKLSTGKVWCFAVGQFGWSVLAALISSWLVNYYQPDAAAVAASGLVALDRAAGIIGAHDFAVFLDIHFRAVSHLRTLQFRQHIPLRHPHGNQRPGHTQRCHFVIHLLQTC